MSSLRGPSRIRRADPTLRSRVAARDGPQAGSSRPLKGLLQVLFSAILVLPRLRALRRTRAWTGVRTALLLAAAAIAILSTGWWRAAALAPALLAILLRRTVDPDRERRMQRTLGAEYLLNGGEWAGAIRDGGQDSLERGTPLYLLLRGPHLLLVPRERDGEIHVALRIDAIERILVDGTEYVPIYVSEAKQPPVRESDVDRHLVSELVLKQRSGESLKFRYRGSFAKHLAETAAHAVFSSRPQQTSTLPIIGNSPSA